MIFLVKTRSEVFEDLSKHDTDKYEYIFPNFEYIKKINLKILKVDLF